MVLSKVKAQRFLISAVVCFSLGVLPALVWVYFELPAVVWFVLMFFVAAPISTMAFKFINAQPDGKRDEQTPGNERTENDKKTT